MPGGSWDGTDVRALRVPAMAGLVGMPFVALGGCSTFERDWEAAASAGAAAEGSLEGRWQGTWLSEVNEHTGDLRAIVTRREKDTGSQAEPRPEYDARYHATYGCCFSFEYTVPMTASREGETLRFEGSADLGWLAGGVYHYTGEVRGDEFHSTYKSEDDHGTFRMRRVR